MKVAIIPARGGSKRIPGKNIRAFHGRPMIAWSIEAALQSQCFDRVLVSTDDASIAEVAQQAGAEVPFMRPAALADDFATTADVMHHAADWLQQQGPTPAQLCCLYATAPFVTAALLAEGQQYLDQPDWDYVFAAVRFDYPIQRALRLLPTGGVDWLQPEMAQQRSQDLEVCYHDAGQFYWGQFDAFLQRRPILGPHSRPLLLDARDAQDIDTEADWAMAEALFALRRGADRR